MESDNYGDCTACEFEQYRAGDRAPCANCRHGERQFGISNWRAKSGVTVRLWECDHPYYCNENDPDEYRSWAAFLEEYEESDPDYNLLFRWDWELDADNKAPANDPYYRDGVLKLFWVVQRKTSHRCSLVDVCKADEPAVRAWLQRKLNYLMQLWTPFLHEEVDDTGAAT